MPYNPDRRTYQFIDEQIAFRQPNQRGTPRNAQVLPQRNYDPVELARAARHQARIEAKQKNRLPSRPNRAVPDEDYEEYDDADIDGNGDVWPPPMPTVTCTYQVGTNGIPFRQTRIDHYHNTPFISRRQQEREVAEPRFRRRVQIHWLVFVGVGLLLMIAGWMAFSSLSSWWQVHQDDSTYGNPALIKLTRLSDTAIAQPTPATSQPKI